MSNFPKNYSPSFDINDPTFRKNKWIVKILLKWVRSIRLINKIIILSLNKYTFNVNVITL